MFPKHLIKHTKDYSATGSRVICDPPVEDTDEDYVVLVRSMGEFEKLVLADGWTKSMGEAYRATVRHAPNEPWGAESSVNIFASYRKGDINLIVTHNVAFFRRYRYATQIATALNLREKEDRITLFNMIRDIPREIF
jgi:hypothetical protein